MREKVREKVAEGREIKSRVRRISVTFLENRRIDLDDEEQACKSERAGIVGEAWEMYVNVELWRLSERRGRFT